MSLILPGRRRKLNPFIVREKSTPAKLRQRLHPGFIQPGLNYQRLSGKGVRQFKPTGMKHQATTGKMLCGAAVLSQIAMLAVADDRMTPVSYTHLRAHETEELSRMPSSA